MQAILSALFVMALASATTPTESGVAATSCVASLGAGVFESGRSLGEADGMIFEVSPGTGRQGELGCENEVEENEPTGRARVRLGVAAVLGFDSGVWERAESAPAFCLHVRERWLFLLYSRLTC